MSSISRDIVNDLKSKIDLADLVGRFLKLKQAGSNFKGKCPFHDESTASFTVTPSKGIFKCFGCGEAGDHITFLQKKENLSFIEAVHWMAKAYGLPIDEAKSNKMRQPHFEKRAAKENEKEGDWDVIYEDFTEEDVRTLFPKSIVQEHYRPPKDDVKNNGLDPLYAILKELNWGRVKTFWRVKKNDDGKLTVTEISSKEDYPIYARTEHWTVQPKDKPALKGTFVKIYQPLHHDKSFKFQHLGEYLPEYMSGIAQASAAKELLVQQYNEDAEEEDRESLLDANDKKGSKKEKEKAKKPKETVKLDRIMICSGERDALAAKAMGYFPVWGNSESAKITEGLLTRLFSLAHNVYNIPDIDAPGLANMHRLSMDPGDEKYLQIKNIILPPELRLQWANGKPCKDLRDYLNHWTPRDFRELMYDAMPYQFWQFVVQEGKFGITEKYVIDIEIVFFFLQQNGFWRFQVNPEGSELPEMCFVQIVDGVVTQVLPGDIKNWVVNFLRTRKFRRDLRNAVLRSSYFSAAMLEGLQTIRLDFTGHSPTTQIMFFENKTWEISAAGIKEFSPGALRGKYVWSDKVIRRRVSVAKEPPFKITWDQVKGFDITINDNDSLFLKFLKNTSAIHWRVEKEGVQMADGSVRKKKTDQEEHEEKLILISKLYALGYLSHRQKFNHRGWFVYGMEHHVTGEGKSSGGTGKSALFGALSHYLRVFKTPGAKRSEDDNHRYGGVNEYTDVVYFDDMNEHFDWRGVYEYVSNDFHVNPKNKPGFTIPFSKSPKLCGSGNFAVRDREQSTDRRQLIVVVSDYYHSANRDTGLKEYNIYDDLGKQLYTDFDDKDWNSMFNVIAEAIRFYMWNPSGEKIEPPMQNVWLKNLRAAIGETFINWADGVFHPKLENTDCFIMREALQQNYSDMMKASNMGKFSLSPQGFKEKLDMYCRLNGMVFMPADVMKVSGIKGRAMVWVASLGAPKEMFYVQTSDENGNPIPINTAVPKLDITKPRNPDKQAAEGVAKELSAEGAPEALPF